MKRVQIIVEMDDDAPLGTALLTALGCMVRDVPTIVDQRSTVVNCWPPDYGVRVVCKMMAPKADA